MKVLWVVPHGLTRSGGSLYNHRMMAALEALGAEVERLELSATWPLPTPPPRLPDGLEADATVVDGLLWTGLGPPRRSLPGVRVVLVHMALHRPAGLSDTERDRRLRLEAAALQDADALVTTGPSELDATLGPSGPSPVWIPPGLDPGPAPPRERPSRVVLTVGPLTPHKRQHALVDAIASLGPEWTWVLAGSRTRDPAYTARVEAAITRSGVRAELTGELDDAGMRAVYDRSTLLLSGSASESYGMAIQEAVARGLPVVTRPAGVLRDLPAGAHATFEEDPTAALATVIADLPGFQRAARHARFPRWTDMAERLLEVVRATGRVGR